MNKKKKTLFSVVENKITRDIENGVYQEGALIPTEQELAAKYNVSPGTARKAALNLARQGILYRVPGKGTMVNFKNYNRIKYFRFVEDIGTETFSFNLSILNIDVISADRKLSACLNLRQGSKIIRLERMGKISDQFLIHTISYLPKRYYKGLESYPKDQFIKNTLWKLQETHYKLKLKQKKEYLSIVQSDAEISRLLEIPESKSILRIEMILISHDDKPIEYRLSHCNIGNNKFVTIQSR
jgi:GntR family transcriptional regulator